MIFRKDGEGLGLPPEYEIMQGMANIFNMVIYQGGDGRTMMHRDVFLYDKKSRAFLCGDLTYSTYLNANVMCGEAIVLPDEFLGSHLYKVRKLNGQDLVQSLLDAGFVQCFIR